MVDTREVFAGLYTGGRQPPWKARLDELLPYPASRSAEDDDFTDVTTASTPAPTPAASVQQSSSPSSAKRKQFSASRSGSGTNKGEEGDEQTGPFYDERADLKDELWVTEKYLRHHQPARPTPSASTTAATTAAAATEGQQQQPKTAQEVEAKKNAKKKKTRPDDWTSDRNDPLTRPRRSDAVLSCPCCFTPLCYDCQRHEVYLSQYRAMFVTDECTARQTEFRMYEGDRYHPVFCAICETEVGVFEPADELYHFFNVIPGN